MGYFKFFFTDWTFFLPCNLPYKLKKKKFLSFKLLSIKSHKISHSDSVKNESARTKSYRGGGRQTPPQPV